MEAKSRNLGRLHRSVATVLALAATVGGCGNNSNSVEGGTVSFMLASVDGGSCAIYDAATGATRLAGPELTKNGVATFADISPTLGMVSIECSGGRYVDEATGRTLTAPRTRSMAKIDSSSFKITASPLTEIATHIARTRSGVDPVAAYAGILANVASSFGLRGADLASVKPIDVNVDAVNTSDEGHYGVALAAISQLESDLGETTAEQVMATLADGLANNGQFTDDQVRDAYLAALENLFLNPRIKVNGALDRDLHELFDEAAAAPLASQVEHVDAEHSPMQSGLPSTVIVANEPSRFDVVGTHLYLGMTVTLGGDSCRLRDVQSIAPYSHATFRQKMVAECAARNAGTAELVVMDRGRVENRTTITIASSVAGEQAQAQLQAAEGLQRKSILAADANLGTSFVFGFVSAEAPSITPPDPAHNYASASLEVFDVAGVSVDLINQAGAVLANTTTDGDGYYEFSGVPESTAVRVVVKAEIARTRTTPGVGAQYSFVVRDNTSTSSPKQPYRLTSGPITTAATGAGANRLDIRASIGFDSAGNPLAGNQRQSAPFAILRIIASATTKLVAADPTIVLPPLNIYWSVNNISVDGDVNLGQINTSHYASDGTMPGLFILGKASSDTDEFDQGVIGHEFGHYLQAQLSYSDNPGGNHSQNEFKDASLAFGEGYGTAIGGLLASGPNANYYCDVSGARQGDGFCGDLTRPVPAGRANGFYSEESIVYLLYQIGRLPGQGFTPFFNAFRQMRNSVHSGTIFAFLNNYLTSNPGASASVRALMAASNIKTSDPFGTLPPGTPADAAISAVANKGSAAAGAPDLEMLYVTLPLLANVAAPGNAAPPSPVTQNEPSVCFNENLRGAASQNGLGMLRRFKVTANFTGRALLRGVDDNNNPLSDQGVYYAVRDSTGAEVSIFGASGVGTEAYYGGFDIVQGREYTIAVHVFNTEMILHGSQCGNRLRLARAS